MVEKPIQAISKEIENGLEDFVAGTGVLPWSSTHRHPNLPFLRNKTQVLAIMIIHYSFCFYSFSAFFLLK